MTRKSLVLVVLATVVLAGCAGSQSAGTPTPETPGEDAGGIDVGDIPGITNGTLTNATVLTQANGGTLAETGGRIRLAKSSPEMDTEGTLSVATSGSYVLTTTRSSSDGESGTVDYWGNESVTYVRSQVAGQTQYREVDGGVGVLTNVNASLEGYLAAGTFTIENSSVEGSTVTLTADDFTTSEDGPLGGADSLEGRLVLSQSGQIQNLTITGQADGQTVTYEYELLHPIVERVSKPSWVSEIPETATLDPHLSFDVENSSVLVIANEGGDRVPRNATLSLTVNDTTETATFETALDSGETRYAYLDATDGSLVVTNDRPTADATATLSSPVSITVTTADGYTLSSGSMGWGSASAGGDESSGSDSGGS